MTTVNCSNGDGIFLVIIIILYFIRFSITDCTLPTIVEALYYLFDSRLRTTPVDALHRTNQSKYGFVENIFKRFEMNYF